MPDQHPLADVLDAVDRGGTRQTEKELHYQLSRHRRATRPGISREDVLELLSEAEQAGLVETEFTAVLTPKGRALLEQQAADPSIVDDFAVRRQPGRTRSRRGQAGGSRVPKRASQP